MLTGWLTLQSPLLGSDLLLEVLLLVLLLLLLVGRSTTRRDSNITKAIVGLSLSTTTQFPRFVHGPESLDRSASLVTT